MRMEEIAIVVGLAAAAAWGVAWYRESAPLPAGVTVEAKPAPAVKDAPKVEVVITHPVKVYKPAVKRDLKLPDSIVKDDGQHVVASSTTPNDERQHTFTTVVDDKTGTFRTFDSVRPSPWLAVSTKSEVGIYYGMKHGEQAIRIDGRQELLQVKALHLGAIASADVMRGGTDGFIGVGAWARW